MLHLNMSLIYQYQSLQDCTKTLHIYIYSFMIVEVYVSREKEKNIAERMNFAASERRSIPWWFIENVAPKMSKMSHQHLCGFLPFSPFKDPNQTSADHSF